MCSSVSACMVGVCRYCGTNNRIGSVANDNLGWGRISTQCQPDVDYKRVNGRKQTLIRINSNIHTPTHTHTHTPTLQRHSHLNPAGSHPPGPHHTATPAPVLASFTAPSVLAAAGHKRRHQPRFSSEPVRSDENIPRRGRLISSCEQGVRCDACICVCAPCAGRELPSLLE